MMISLMRLDADGIEIVDHSVSISDWLQSSLVDSVDSQSSTGARNIFSSEKIAKHLTFKIKDPLLHSSNLEEFTQQSRGKLLDKIVDVFSDLPDHRLGYLCKAYLSFRDKYCTTPGIFIGADWLRDNTFFVVFMQSSKEESAALSLDPNEGLRFLGKAMLEMHNDYSVNPVDFFLKRL